MISETINGQVIRVKWCKKKERKKERSSENNMKERWGIKKEREK